MSFYPSVVMNVEQDADDPVSHRGHFTQMRLMRDLTRLRSSRVSTGSAQVTFWTALHWRPGYFVAG